MRELKKQDRTSSRLPTDTERKYKLGQIELTAEEVEKLKSELVVDEYLSTASPNAIANKTVTIALNNKVTKEVNKGLSSNDFTDEYKNKSHTHANKSVIDNITQEDIDNWNSGTGGGGGDPVTVNAAKILWINPNPKNSFDAQTITLNDDISNYDMYCVIFIQNINSTNQLTTGIVPIGDTFVNMAINKNYRRTLTVEGTSLTFNNAVAFPTYGNTTQETNNAQLIPTYVIGFKFGLF